MPNHDDKKARSRHHLYECGTKLAESFVEGSTPSYIATMAICPAALVTLSRALSYVSNKFDLATTTTFDTCEMVAEKTANFTAKGIYMAIRNSYAMQDNFRLPPIPTLASHIRDIAKEKLKE